MNMNSTSASILSIVTTLSLGTFLIICISTISRWRRGSLYRSIPGPKPSTILGYLLDLHSPDGLAWHFGMTEKYGHVAKLGGGLMGSDALYITDPSALHSILVRDHDLFRESTEFAGLFGIIHHGDGVASVYGAEHKKQRKLIDPIFTASQISRLTPLFYNVARQLQTSLTNEILDAPAGHTIDILDRLTRTSLELIAQGGLGHTFNSLDKDSQEYTKFHHAITSVLPLASGLFLVLPYLNSWRKMQPVWLRRFFASMIPYIPWPSARKFKAAVDTMHPVYQTLFEGKKATYLEGGVAALEESATGGKDLMTILFKSNWEAEEEDKLADDVVIANIGSVVHGAQETTSGALARFISLMAMDLALQGRMREEIREARESKGNGEDLDFYELNNLPLLDAVCKETLRVFSPVTFVWRQTIQDTVVPLQFPIRDAHSGSETHDLLISEGTPVYLGLAAANRSTAIWGPDASEFKPDRWLKKDSAEGTADSQKLPGIYSNIMTFLGGERSCPGYRFALLEIKLVLAVLLEAFSFEEATGSIDWRLGITLTPYVRGEEHTGPRVPVKVNLLD